MSLTYPMIHSLFGPLPLGMADEPAGAPEGDKGGAAVAEPKAPKQKPAPKGKTRPKLPGPRHLPPYKVLLHNDDKNTFEHVILTLIELTPLDFDEATQITFEALPALNEVCDDRAGGVNPELSVGSGRDWLAL